MEITRRFRVRKYRKRSKNSVWHVYTWSKYSPWWKFVNYYPTHAEALENAIKYADYYSTVMRYFRTKHP